MQHIRLKNALKLLFSLVLHGQLASAIHTHNAGGPHPIPTPALITLPVVSINEFNSRRIDDEERILLERNEKIIAHNRRVREIEAILRTFIRTKPVSSYVPSMSPESSYSPKEVRPRQYTNRPISLTHIQEPLTQLTSNNQATRIETGLTVAYVITGMVNRIAANVSRVSRKNK